MGHIDDVINDSLNDFEEKKRKNTEFGPFVFAPTQEEKHRLIYKCIFNYDMSKVLPPKKKKTKKRNKSK